MRQGTLLFWLAAIVLFAVFGLAFLKFVAIAIGLFLLFVFGSIVVGTWLLRRRMNRKMAEFQQSFRQAQEQAQAQQRSAAMRRDAIDVEPVDIRDERK